jgi:phosphoribosyl 1,2-cyclic phosphodiesterase
MKITNLASSSNGNCYLIQNEETKILMECGIPLIKIMDKLFDEGVKITDISGCLISHKHSDHCLALKEVGYYIPIYASAETLGDYKGNIIQPLKAFRINNIKVIPFEVEHDCEGAYGYILQDKEETIFFATDFSLCKYKFPYEFTSIIIECNYLDELIKDKELSEQEKRVLNTHLSLNSLLKHLEQMNLNKCKEIILIHLSDRRSDEELMRKTVKEKYPNIEIRIANKRGGIK